MVELADLALDIAIRTDPGKEPSKQVNEDSSGDRKTAFGHLIVVCDGMGGHSGGLEASQAALAAIYRTFDVAETASPSREVLRLSIQHANEMVYKLAPPSRLGDDLSRPGSTVVAMLVHAHGVDIGHVGDSRCYRVRGHAIEAMTKDHSIVQEMVDAKMLSPEQAKGHPDANRITRALGSRMDVAVDVTTVDYAAGDVFVSCSDGLSDVVDPEDILRIVTGGSAEQAAGQLVDLANARGGPDNITVTVVRTRANAAFRGVAKTLPDHPADADTPVPGAPPAAAPAPQKTLVQAPIPAASGPEVEGQALAAPQAAPSEPIHESSHPPSEPRRRTPIGLVVAIALVVVGLGVGGFALYKFQTTPKHVVPPMLPTTPGVASTTTVKTVAPRTTEDDEVEPLRPLGDGGVRD